MFSTQGQFHRTSLISSLKREGTFTSISFSPKKNLLKKKEKTLLILYIYILSIYIYIYIYIIYIYISIYLSIIYISIYIYIYIYIYISLSLSISLYIYIYLYLSLYLLYIYIYIYTHTDQQVNFIVEPSNQHSLPNTASSKMTNSKVSPILLLVFVEPGAVLGVNGRTGHAQIFQASANSEGLGIHRAEFTQIIRFRL